MIMSCGVDMVLDLFFDLIKPSLSHFLLSLYVQSRDKRLDDYPGQLWFLAGFNKVVPMLFRLGPTRAVSALSLAAGYVKEVGALELFAFKMVGDIFDPSLAYGEFASKDLLSLLDEAQILFLQTVAANSDFWIKGYFGKTLAAYGLPGTQKELQELLSNLGDG